jgi:hypothetical protein
MIALQFHHVTALGWPRTLNTVLRVANPFGAASSRSFASGESTWAPADQFGLSRSNGYRRLVDNREVEKAKLVDLSHVGCHSLELSDGTSVLARPLRMEDVQAVGAFYAGLAPESMLPVKHSTRAHGTDGQQVSDYQTVSFCKLLGDAVVTGLYAKDRLVGLGFFLRGAGSCRPWGTVVAGDVHGKGADTALKMGQLLHAVEDGYTSMCNSHLSPSIAAVYRQACKELGLPISEEISCDDSGKTAFDVAVDLRLELVRGGILRPIAGTCPQWVKVIQRTEAITHRTLASADQFGPLEAQVTPSSESQLRGAPLPHPERSCRAVVSFGLTQMQIRTFLAQYGLKFIGARDVQFFSGEEILQTSRSITASTQPLPLRHLMSEVQIQAQGTHGNEVRDGAITLNGNDYLMRLSPFQRTADGKLTGWNGQQPHFHQGEWEFHDQRILHGIVPPKVTVVLFHAGGAEVVPSGTFAAIYIEPRAGHQFCTVHEELLKGDPELQQALRIPGSLSPSKIAHLHDFMSRNKVIPGVEFDSLTRYQLVQASALFVSSHTWDPPPPTSLDGQKVNEMAAQTLGIANPPASFARWLPPTGSSDA